MILAFGMTGCFLGAKTENQNSSKMNRQLSSSLSTKFLHEKLGVLQDGFVHKDFYVQWTSLKP